MWSEPQSYHIVIEKESNDINIKFLPVLPMEFNNNAAGVIEKDIAEDEKRT